MGFQPATAAITVLDVDLPQLTLQLTTNSVVEGQAIAGILSRSAGTNEAVSVVVASSNPGQLLVPEPVTIPAGAFTAPFALLALDDSLIENPATYMVGVTVAGYLGAASEVTVYDDDLPVVTVSIAPDSVSEGAGSQAAVARITRSPVSSRLLMVELESSNTDAARVPARVTIPAGKPMSPFPSSRWTTPSWTVRNWCRCFHGFSPAAACASRKAIRATSRLLMTTAPRCNFPSTASSLPKGSIPPPPARSRATAAPIPRCW
jgi:hypothetical protein